MFKEGDIREIREKINKAESDEYESLKIQEVFFNKIDPSLFKVTKGEQVRYEENDKFSELVYPDLMDMIDGKLSVDQVINKIKESKLKLSPPQGEVLDKIKEKLELRSGKKEGEQNNPGERTLNFFYSRSKSLEDGVKKIFYDNQSVKTRYKIDEKDLLVTSWGALVVKVKDEEVWKEYLRQFMGSESEDSIHINGFKNNFPLGLVVDGKLKSSMAREQFKRTVFIDDTGKHDKEDVEKTQRHELFHELYENLINRNYEINYSDNYRKNFFSNVKNEVIAYLIANDWRYEIKNLLPSSGVNRIEGEKAWFDNLKDDMIQNLSIDKYEKYYFENNEKGFNNLFKYQEFASKEDLKKFEKMSYTFSRSVALLIRQLVRLNYLKSDKFEEAIKAVLTAQDFKEITYKLSKIENDRVPDMLSFPELNNLEDPENVYILFEAVQELRNNRLTLKNIDRFIKILEDAKDKTRNNESREVIFEILKYCKENKSDFDILDEKEPVGN